MSLEDTKLVENVFNDYSLTLDEISKLGNHVKYNGNVVVNK